MIPIADVVALMASRTFRLWFDLLIILLQV